MSLQESETVELKARVVDEIKNEVVAFANSQGGTLYVGVLDDGEWIGVEDVDAALLQISNMVRDAIKPDVTMFVHYDVLERDGKRVISVSVQRGTDRPYYLAKKGLRPAGVYVRQGASAAPASDTAIREMIKETDGDRFEEMRALEQELTFVATSQEFERRGLVFGTEQMRTLKLINSDGLYTNLALLLSEQCPHTIKVAVFEGEDQRVFKDRREFSGSLLHQMNEAYDYLDHYNQIHATFDKLLRIDRRDYPEEALREALMNLLVHRDYAFHASGLISVYTDRIEFVSIGGLLPGILLEDVMAGVSVCRNQNLANVFYRLRLIEAYGTGIKKIMNAYGGTELTPLIETTHNTFKVILPNVNAEVTTETVSHYNDVVDDETRIVCLAKECGVITRAEVEARLGISASTATRLLREMTQSGQLMRIGKGRQTKYQLK